METKIVSEEDLDAAVAFLRQGIPIAFPTETVYGLGACVSNQDGLARLFTIKGRPLDNPLIVHISSLSQISLLAHNVPEAFFQLAEKFWPGPLTLIAERSPLIPAQVSAGHPTIAIRMPSHPVALRLIEALQEPLAAPSANLSGRPSPTSARDVLEDLAGRIPLIIDGGECAIGIESSVLSLIGKAPTLLRPGHIRKEELEAALKRPVDFAGRDSPVHSPGMKYRHYAPRARVKLVFDLSQLKGPFILSKAKIALARYLSAKTLYAELRRADREMAEEIEVYCDAEVLSDFALMNRLVRASGQQLDKIRF